MQRTRVVRVYDEGEHENGGCCTIVFKVANAEPSTEFPEMPKYTACNCLTNPEEQRSGESIASNLYDVPSATADFRFY